MRTKFQPANRSKAPSPLKPIDSGRTSLPDTSSGTLQSPPLLALGARPTPRSIPKKYLGGVGHQQIKFSKIFLPQALEKLPLRARHHQNISSLQRLEMLSGAPPGPFFFRPPTDHPSRRFQPAAGAACSSDKHTGSWVSRFQCIPNIPKN